MNKPYPPEVQRRLRALYSYVQALEAGNLESLSRLLRAAEKDAILDQMFQEVDLYYQAQEQLLLRPDEVAALEQNLAKLSVQGTEHEQARQNGAQERPHLLSLPQESRYRIMHHPAHSWLAEQATPDMPQIDPPEKKTRQQHSSRFLQMLAASLVVIILISGFLLIFHNRSNTITASHPATPSANLLIGAYADQSDHIARITALQAETGAVAWTYNTHQQTEIKVKNVSVLPTLEAQITTNNQVVYVTINSHVYALHAQTGKLIWQDQPPFDGAQIDSSLIFDNGLLYVTYGLNHLSNLPYTPDTLYALNAQNGTLAWKHTLSLASTTFTVSNGIAYLNTSTDDPRTPGTLTALKGSDGHFLWSYATNPISMLVANNVLYIQSEHQQTASDQGGNKGDKPLLALNATTGHLLWVVHVEDGGPSSLVFSDNLVILYRTTLQVAQFCAYRSSDGSQAWCTPGKEGPADEDTGNYLVANGTLYVSFAAPTEPQPSRSETIEALNPQNGNVYWSKQVSGNADTRVETALQGALYLVQFQDTNTGIVANVIALSTGDGHTLWKVQSNGLAPTLVANT